MNFEKLTEENFVLYAAKYYDNLNCESQEEFEQDLDRIKYVKRLFRKYHLSGELRERLILNHIIVLYNVFYPEACTRMLVYKLSDYLEYLKPFLVYLQYWPPEESDVTMDLGIIDRIRSI